MSAEEHDRRRFLKFLLASPFLAQFAEVAEGWQLPEDVISSPERALNVLEFEAAAQGVAFATDYHRAAVRRFIDKQPPLFRWPPVKPQE